MNFRKINEWRRFILSISCFNIFFNVLSNFSTHRVHNVVQVLSGIFESKEKPVARSQNWEKTHQQLRTPKLQINIRHTRDTKRWNFPTWKINRTISKFTRRRAIKTDPVKNIFETIISLETVALDRFSEKNIFYAHQRFPNDRHRLVKKQVSIMVNSANFS